MNPFEEDFANNILSDFFGAFQASLINDLVLGQRNKDAMGLLSYDSRYVLEHRNLELSPVKVCISTQQTTDTILLFAEYLESIGFDFRYDATCISYKIFQNIFLYAEDKTVNLKLLKIIEDYLNPADYLFFYNNLNQEDLAGEISSELGKLFLLKTVIYNVDRKSDLINLICDYTIEEDNIFSQYFATSAWDFVLDMDENIQNRAEIISSMIHRNKTAIDGKNLILSLAKSKNLCAEFETESLAEILRYCFKNYIEFFFISYGSKNIEEVAEDIENQVFLDCFQTLLQQECEPGMVGLNFLIFEYT